MDSALLQRTAEIAGEYLASLPERPVGADASLEELRSALRVGLDDAPQPALRVVEELVTAVEPGLVASQSPRYFGFVIGGGLDAAIAADWLTSVWDQNGGGYPVGPSAAVAEEVVCEWLLDILGLPGDAGVGLTTGCQMAHLTCLAAARNRVLADAGWDAEADGLFGAPPIRVFVGAKAHTTVFAALRMLGLGSRRVEVVAADDQGRMCATELARRLASGEGPAVGGGEPSAAGARRRRRRSRLLGHRRAQVAQRAVRLGHRDRPRPGRARRRDELVRRRRVHPTAAAGRAKPGRVVPEFSRRARGFAVYAALRELGRRGLAELVERCCACARLMADELARDPRVTVLNDVVLNQVLVRFACDGTNVTDNVIDAIQREGTCWMSGTEWQGEPAMRISVCNWRTTEHDIRRSATAILEQADVAAQASR